MKDIDSLAHTKWRCQYHIVFAPKYRRQIIYGKYKAAIGKILRRICERWSGNHRGKCVRRPYSYVGNNTAEAECKQIHGDTQREE